MQPAKLAYRKDGEDWVDLDDFAASPRFAEATEIERPRDYPTTDYRGDNYLSREGALEIKRRIEAYWAARGFDVSVRVESAEFHPAVRSARLDVRSDMINGMPLRKKRAD